MEMVVEGFNMCNTDLMHYNISHKHQQTTFLSDITAARGGIIEKLLIPG